MIFKSGLLTAYCGLTAVLCLAAVVSAHPGERLEKREALRQAAFNHHVARVNKRALDACSQRPDVQARRERAMERRFETFRKLREKKGLAHLKTVERRTSDQFAKYNSLSHDKTASLKLDSSAPSKEVFGANTSCVLAPDNADGPYFVWGEKVRSDVSENVPGIPMHLELQFVDVADCRPAPRLLVDVWACNATGAYSGISAAGEGGLATTYLRGVQPTDSDGVVNFDAVFPGHYAGRATHQHMIVHANATLQPNGSYTGGHVAHLSQLFFDQALVDRIEATAPYNANTIPSTTNLADFFTGYAASDAYDPFPEFVMLGPELADGLFVWAEVGLNTSANYDYYAPPAAWDLEVGPTDNPDFWWEQLVTGFPPPTHG